MSLLDEMLAISLINYGEACWWEVQSVGKSHIIFQWHQVSDDFARTDTLDNFEGNIVVMVIDECQTLPSLQLEGIGLRQLHRVHLGRHPRVGYLVGTLRLDRLDDDMFYLVTLLELKVAASDDVLVLDDTAVGQSSHQPRAGSVYDVLVLEVSQRDQTVLRADDVAVDVVATHEASFSVAQLEAAFGLGYLEFVARFPASVGFVLFVLGWVRSDCDQ